MASRVDMDGSAGKRGKGSVPDEPALPYIGEFGREPRTQGERIRWIRSQLGDEVGVPMRREDFCTLLARRSGEEPRTTTTMFRWERDEGRGPTLKEGVAMARLVGRTAEWLSALDDYKAELEAQRQATIHAPKPKGAVEGRRGVDVTPREQPMRKQGHRRGRRA